MTVLDLGMVTPTISISSLKKVWSSLGTPAVSWSLLIKNTEPKANNSQIVFCDVTYHVVLRLESTKFRWFPTLERRWRTARGTGIWSSRPTSSKWTLHLSGRFTMGYRKWECSFRVSMNDERASMAFTGLPSVERVVRWKTLILPDKLAQTLLSDSIIRLLVEPLEANSFVNWLVISN